MSALHEVYFGTNLEKKGDDEFTQNRIQHLAGERNDADLLTKGFSYDRHWKLCEMIGLRPVPRSALEQRAREKRARR